MGEGGDGRKGPGGKEVSGIARTKVQRSQTARPSDQPASPAQQTQRERFQEAIAYAKETKDETVYVEKATGTAKSAYNVATADWLHAPEVVV